MRARFLDAGVHCVGETGGVEGGDKEYAVIGSSLVARAPGLNPPYSPLGHRECHWCNPEHFLA